ncbi:MAG: hypothetical protein M1837_000969 [Sclerophora amabilis]|nr:MAG: hypothetical protein M1837_000969 [Sclerophora amabilis]
MSVSSGSLQASLNVVVRFVQDYLFLNLFALVLFWLLATRYRSGLRNVPGPFVASISNGWKLYAVFKQSMPRLNIDLHKTHGPLVRIGPNHVSISDPEALKTVYGFTNIYRKSAFYPMGEAYHEGKLLPNLFTTQNNDYHAALKRVAGNAFSMSAVAELEPYVNNCVDLFISQVEEISESGSKAIDISAWLQYFAFDVLGEINFSRQLGFLKSGSDVENMIAAIDMVLQYVSVIGQVPKLHYFLLGNPLLPKLVPGFEDANQILGFSLKMCRERLQNPVERKDILTRLFETHKASPEKLSFREIVAITTTNIIAGSDTTAITLRAVLYHLCRNHEIYEKLRAEIAEAEAANQLSSPVTYNEAAKLPYLSAIMNEAMRIHPSTGFILERLVPAGGATLCGTHLPENTVVGVNAWVIHRNTDIFGQDVETFRPERWIDSSPEEIKMMHRNLFAFGAGPRICIGKNISLMEMWKIVPEIVRHFDFRLSEPKKEWKIQGLWFVKQTEMDMVFTRRARASVANGTA